MAVGQWAGCAAAPRAAGEPRRAAAWPLASCAISQALTEPPRAHACPAEGQDPASSRPPPGTMCPAAGDPEPDPEQQWCEGRAALCPQHAASSCSAPRRCCGCVWLRLGGARKARQSSDSTTSSPSPPQGAAAQPTSAPAVIISPGGGRECSIHSNQDATQLPTASEPPQTRGALALPPARTHKRSGQPPDGQALQHRWERPSPRSPRHRLVFVHGCPGHATRE